MLDNGHALNVLPAAGVNGIEPEHGEYIPCACLPAVVVTAQSVRRVAVQGLADVPYPLLPGIPLTAEEEQERNVV